MRLSSWRRYRVWRRRHGGIMFGAGRRFEMRVVLLVAALLISCGEALSAVYGFWLAGTIMRSHITVRRSSTPELSTADADSWGHARVTQQHHNSMRFAVNAFELADAGSLTAIDARRGRQSLVKRAVLQTVTDLNVPGPWWRDKMPDHLSSPRLPYRELPRD